MKRLLACLGEILYDFLPNTNSEEPTGFSLHPGGGPFNVAVGLARLGQPTAFVGKVGSDYFGRRLRRTVRAEQIDDRWLRSAAAPSTLAFVAIEDGEPAFSFYGAGAADTLLEPDELPAEFFERTALLHFGGISLLHGTTPAAALAAAEGLHGRALVSLDINVRPRLIGDEAAYRATLRRAIAACDLLKLSAADIAWLAPGTDPAVYASAQLDLGPTLVALTRGGDGVTSFRRINGALERLDQPSFAVDVADTVGAGDAFTAGLLAALAHQSALTRAALVAVPAAALCAALRQGSATAALTCTRPGADPPHYNALQEFLAHAA
ncbi:MAG: carbohydrate kinase [Candidatus Viridilinea halotolerans]|uniref:Carbohydrate kinase n=1 Tax=Candidatus Viridilinea halotolerans TaxID=2491704 RepID=A0A426TZT1_9CHLR|nr:MAG: carbohydrate kinase [Candidatus Viridilinea halotolerans]